MDFRSFRKEDLENFQQAMLGLDEEEDSSDVSERIHKCLEKSDNVDKIILEAASLLKNDEDKEEESRVQFEMQGKNYNDRAIIERMYNDLKPINVDFLNIAKEIDETPLEHERIRRRSFDSRDDTFRGHSQDFQKPCYDDVTPQPNDVLSGRIPGVPTHPGNEYYRYLVRLNKVHYVSSSPSEKKNIITFIMHRILNKLPPGRFLKASSKDGKIKYSAMSAAEAKRKIGQALRENAPRLRKELIQRAKNMKPKLDKNGYSPSLNLTNSYSIPPHQHPAMNRNLQHYDMRKVSLVKDTATKQEAQTQNTSTSTSATQFPYNLLNGVSDKHIWDHVDDLDKKPTSDDLNTKFKSDEKGSFSEIRHTPEARFYVIGKVKEEMGTSKQEK